MPVPRLSWQAFEKNNMPLSDSNKRKLSSARTGLKTRVSKHNKLALEVLGPLPMTEDNEDSPLFNAAVRLQDLTKVNEWDTETRRRANRASTRSAEYFGVDLPSSRGMPLGSEQLARAGAYEIVLRCAWLSHLLHEICLSLVVQVEIFRRTIRRTPGTGHVSQKNKAKSAAKMREQYRSVRVYAQQYNLFRDRMNSIQPAHAFEDAHPEYKPVARVNRRDFKALSANDISCDTTAYDTLGPNTFSLPWFWKMSSRTQDISDDSFVQDCMWLSWWYFAAI